MINVTKSFFPPINEYFRELHRVWENQWLTNRGELVQELEEKLIDFLDVKHLTLTANGTLPLQLSIKALNLSGEIITTPFSYVATTSSIVWEGCVPVFVDIHPEYLTIDEEKIEEAITPRTSAILATHVFGNPCHVERIEEIAQKHNLKVIYDGAHCFGVKYKGRSIFNYGDVSTCSFHATKLFHTGEGGCWITNNAELQHELFYRHNFGHNGVEDFYGAGINAKMSELCAAMGLSVLPHMVDIISKRKESVNYYLSMMNGKSIDTIRLREYVDWNYHYFPIIFDKEESLVEFKKKANLKSIYPRRYFYPSLNTLNYVTGIFCPISESISKRVMCLPLSHDLSFEIQDEITSLLP